MTPKPLLVIGCGNPGRGDDALGPECLQRLEVLQKLRPGWPAIEYIEDLQLNPEHAVDLLDRELVLFVDADVSCSPPFTFIRVQADRNTSYSSHAMSPAAVVHVYKEVYGSTAPPCFLLSVRGVEFELGGPMSEHAETNLESACHFCERLFESTELAAWNRLVTDP